MGGPVTSPYGMRVHPVTGVRKLHDGTDFGVACGTAVHAAAAGTVVSAFVEQCVRQADRDPTSTGLRDVLQPPEPAVGRRSVNDVGRGEVIGRSGNTGLSTGCHLHFMVLKDGRAVDPAKFLLGPRVRQLVGGA